MHYLILSPMKNLEHWEFALLPLSLLYNLRGALKGRAPCAMRQKYSKTRRSVAKIRSQDPEDWTRLTYRPLIQTNGKKSPWQLLSNNRNKKSRLTFVMRALFWINKCHCRCSYGILIVVRNTEKCIRFSTDWKSKTWLELQTFNWYISYNPLAKLVRSKCSNWQNF